MLLELLPESPPSLANFVDGRNGVALAALSEWLCPDNAVPAFLLWGAAGAGKSHLLRACADACELRYFDGAAKPGLVEIYEALTEDELWVPQLAVDNVEALDADGQQVLFNAFNRARLTGGKLLLATTLPPQGLNLREDLRTRLGSALIFGLEPLSDAEKSAALRGQAESRGLSLPEDALNYLLRHAPRDMRSLSGLVVALDRLSLERQRPITLPLLREVLHNEQSES